MFPYCLTLQYKNKYEQVHGHIQQKGEQNAQNKYQGYELAGLPFLNYCIIPHNPNHRKAYITYKSYPTEKY